MHILKKAIKTYDKEIRLYLDEENNRITITL